MPVKAREAARPGMTLPSYLLPAHMQVRRPKSRGIRSVQYSSVLEVSFSRSSLMLEACRAVVRGPNLTVF